MSESGKGASEVLIGEAPPSPAGPILDDSFHEAMPPALGVPRPLQTIRFSMRQAQFVLNAQREHGEVFRFKGVLKGKTNVITSHPDHVKSLFTAKPEEAPSITGESPLRPVVGPHSVLTLIGPQHMRQRKLLLPPFHGEAIQQYMAMIAEAANREIDRWPLDESFALAPAMQAITLDVIMSGIFGIDGVPPKGTPERRLRDSVRWVVANSMTPAAKMLEILNAGRTELIWPATRVFARLDSYVYAVISERRAAGSSGRTDILSMLLEARDEDGNAMTDEELRDELLTLVLAGHETTANSLAWTFERLLRTPPAYDRLREEVRDSEDGDDYVEATIYEAMRVRPVIPVIGRRVAVPWRLGDYQVPPGSAVLMSIFLLHHREDVYPDPFSFRPERFLGVRPGAYTWISFGGGTRRCLGAALAMAEQRVVLKAIAQRTDMVAPSEEPERPQHRNVTMIPDKGAEVVITRKL